MKFSLLIFLAVGISACEMKIGGLHDIAANDLIKASKSANVEIDTNEIISVIKAEASVVITTLPQWETVPATELPNGVPIAFGYFSIADPSVPAGYYTLKAIADPDTLGIVEGRIQFLDQSGQVATEIPGEVEVLQMNVPQNPPYEGTFVTASVQPQSLTIPNDDVTILICCSNGVCIRIHRAFTERRRNVN